MDDEGQAGHRWLLLYSALSWDCPVRENPGRPTIRSRWMFLVVLGALVLVGLVLTQRGRTFASDAPAAGPIIYTVSSNCSASVTYTGTGGTTEQQSGVQFGWSRQVSPGHTAHISARTSCSSSWVEVTIERDGHVFKNATNKGDYVTADASVTFQ